MIDQGEVELPLVLSFPKLNICKIFDDFEFLFSASVVIINISRL